MFANKIRSVSERNHLLRLRIAYRIQKLAENIIRDEVAAAQSKNRSDPAYLSFTQIGEVLGITRTAAFARYGGKKNEQNEH